MGQRGYQTFYPKKKKKKKEEAQIQPQIYGIGDKISYVPFFFFQMIK